MAFLGLGGLDLLRGGAKRLGDFSFFPSASATTGEEITPTGGGAVTTQVSDQVTISPKASVAPVQSTIQAPISGIIPRDQVTTEIARKLTSPAGSGVSQFSTGEVGVLSQAERDLIRGQALTPQEQQDVIRLEARRQRAIDERGINPNVKLSGAELVLRKREQEALSKKFITSKFGSGAFVDGKLFANPKFATGGK